LVSNLNKNLVKLFKENIYFKKNVDFSKKWDLCEKLVFF
jgi:hypothetical protein